MLEPRRIAARLAARFVAAERGEAVGETVGYQVRFEEVAGPRTRLRFLTEGVLTRRLLSDPALERVGAVVLDEFHERHLEGDLALALLRRLQRDRAGPICAWWSCRPRSMPRRWRHTWATRACCAPRAGSIRSKSSTRRTPPAPLEEQVAAALERLAARGRRGHVLVFLPGAAEIRRAQRPARRWRGRHGWLLLPLHGDQSPEEQDRAVAPSRADEDHPLPPTWRKAPSPSKA